MRSQVITLAIIVAALHVADAEAKPRVVVCEFSGPRRLADSGRATVMGVLGDQYTIVATKNWDDAKAKNSGRGPGAWRQAAKQSGVDALIEGWVEPEGRHNKLTVAVREAATGRELDTVTIRIKDDGISRQDTEKLSFQLADLLTWIDSEIGKDPKPTLPEIDTRNPMVGSTTRNKRASADEEFDDGNDGYDDRGPSRRRGGGRRSSIDDDRGYPSERGYPSDRGSDRYDPDARDPRDARDEYEDEREARRRQDLADRERTRIATHREEPKRVATAAKDESDLVKLFGPESPEADVVTGGKIRKVSKPTSRFFVAAGPYVSARGMTFAYDPEASGNPPEYPGQTVKGFAARAAVYPMPNKKIDGEVSGLGFSFDIQKSVLSVFSGQDESGYGDYTLDHVAWETGVHYRHPVDFVSVDFDANFGNFSHRIVDLPASIQVPDTSYSYIGLGARLDLKVTEGTTVGFGARYMYLLSAGDISDEDWYGAGKAWGAALDGNFVIPVSKSLFVRGDIEYRRVKVDFEGSGALTMEWGVWEVVDSAISGTAQLGVHF